MNAPSNQQFTAVVLAASRGDETRAEFGVTHKCALEVAGTPMLMRVLEALKNSASIKSIAISIDNPEILQDMPGYEAIDAKILSSRSSPSASVGGAMDELDQPYPMLVTTADNALLSVDAVDEFCYDALITDTSLAVGLARESDVNALFPDNHRTFWQFSDGGYSGCNLYALMNSEARSIIDLWQEAEKNRKKPWKIVRLLGLKPMLAFLLKSWTITQMLNYASRRFGASAAPVILSRAEVAMDVDKAEHLEMVRNYLDF